MKTTYLHIRFDEEEKEKIQKAAKAECRSLTGLVTIAVKEYLERHHSGTNNNNK